MNDQPIMIERMYNSPVDLVWQAISDKAKMKEWYFDMADFKLNLGAEFTFYGGDETQFLHRCKITELEPDKKLTYSWRFDSYDGISYVTFEMFPENGNTKLRLTHTGLETFPNIPQFARQNFVDGWTYIIGTSLKEFLETQNV
ncbi:MAG: SRPBCC domain-containing protein [Ferruginibacter sp.]